MKASRSVRHIAWVTSSILLLSNIAFASQSEWIDIASRTKTTRTTSSMIPVLQINEEDTGYNLHVEVPGFWRSTRSEAGESFNEITLPEFTPSPEVGKPAIPVRTIMLELPPGKKPRIRVRSKTEVSLSDMTILPAQPLPPDVYPEPPAPPFQKDAALYSTDEPFPPNNIISQDIVEIRDKRFVSLLVTPMQVLGGSSKVIVAADMDISVDFADAQLDDFDSHSLVEDEPSLRSEADASTLPIYMILMDDQFDGNSNLNTFIDWKKRKGYDVRTVKTSEINANGAPSNTEIVNYMRALSSENYPDYLLILGDHTAANGVAGYSFSTMMGGYSDLYIMCRTATDYLPDLYCGRLPAKNSTQLNQMLSNVLAMDRNPPTSDMFQKVCVAGQIQDHDPKNSQADRLFCETADSLACYFEQDAGGVDYTCTRAIVNPDSASSACTWNSGSIVWNGTEQIGTRVHNHFMGATDARNRIMSLVNSGISLLQHRDHGYSSGRGWADPYFVTSHVNTLTNGANRPAIFSVNCASGAYHHDDNFTRAWIQHSNGGAYAVFAPVDISYSWLNDWLTHGFYTAFLSNYLSWHNASTSPNWPKNLPSPGGSYGSAGSAKRLGEILNFGKMYMFEKYYHHENTFRLFHLFGDPEAYLQLVTPASLSVSHAADVSFGSQTITVTTGEDGCNVCLYSDGLNIHEAATTSGGSASFNVNVEDSGTIYVTVTKYGKRPYEGSIAAFGSEDFWFRATALTNSVVLRWLNPRYCGMSNETVHIRYRDDQYPTSTSDGSQAYEGTAQEYEHTGLSSGQPYYYTIWVSDDGSTFVTPP